MRLALSGLIRATTNLPCSVSVSMLSFDIGFQPSNRAADEGQQSVLDHDRKIVIDVWKVDLASKKVDGVCGDLADVRAE